MTSRCADVALDRPAVPILRRAHRGCGGRQRRPWDYIEDCQVCCRPIAISVRLDEEDGEPRVRARREDEA
ncbi:CPXCG motif-containing cysteine-rich protein [Pseudoxanthomonas sp. NC8]|nr:CPXCG motif-containing cysteine-rich protein [Pseudoxanthomonas sp. NC8]